MASAPQVKSLLLEFECGHGEVAQQIRHPAKVEDTRFEDEENANSPHSYPGTNFERR